MARVGYVPTVSAYRGNFGQQLMKVGDTLEGVSKEYAQKEKAELAEAKKIYTQGLNINLYNSINELRNDPKLSANPKGLGDAMDKVLEKTLADVDDEDVKIDVMVDYQLKRGTYVNQAQNEFNRIQRAKAKSYAYDSVYANIDSMGMSFANALTGNYTKDDIANYQHSLDRINANINAKNPDGTYVFTDRQRRAMMKDAQSSYLNGFKAVFEQLDEKQQRDVEDAINNNTYVVAQIDNKENPEEKINVGLRDVVGDSSYKDIQNYVKKYNRAALVEREKERKYQGRLATDDFLRNPTEENLEKVYELNPNMSDKTKDKYKDILVNDPVYQAEQKTYYGDMTVAQKEINDFIATDFDSDDERIFELASVVEKINKSANKGKLEEEDVDGLKKMLLTASMNKQVADNIKEFNAFNYTYWEQIFGMPSYRNAKIRKELEDMALPVQRQIIEGLSNGASPDEMKDFLKKNRRRFINFKYPEIEDKQVGDTINKRGITYKIISLDPVPTLEPVE